MQVTENKMLGGALSLKAGGIGGCDMMGFVSRDSVLARINNSQYPYYQVSISVEHLT